MSNKPEIFTSFWGSPRCEPRGKDVARFVEAIRDQADKQTDKRALSICTSALAAIVFYVVQRFKPREALALLDKIKAEIIGQ